MLLDGMLGTGDIDASFGELAANVPPMPSVDTDSDADADADTDARQNSIVSVMARLIQRSFRQFAVETAPRCQKAGAESRSVDRQSGPQTSPDSIQTAHDLIDMMDRMRTIEVEAADLVASEITEFTIEERQTMYGDLHGITPVDDETPTFLAAKLDDLDVELHLIKSKPAYDLARRLDATYVDDPKLRLMFLRTDSFNPHKAAMRLVGWFNVKLDLFGKDLLVQEITQDDLCDTSRRAIEDCIAQILPVRDTAGRTVVCSMHWTHEIFMSKASRRLFFYLSMVLAQDESNQRNGLVVVRGIHSMTCDMTPIQWLNLYMCASITQYTPVRLQGFHILAENTPLMRRFASFTQASSSKDVRHRFRVHYGSVTECMYSLISFGIPVSLIALPVNGAINDPWHTRWMQRRKQVEAVIMAKRRQRNGRTSQTPGQQDFEYSSAPQTQELEDERIADISRISSNGTDDSTVSLSQKYVRVNVVPPVTAADTKLLLDPSSVSDKSSSKDGSDDRSYTSGSISMPSSCAENSVLEPTELDVLMGRGRPFQNHPGNKRMRSLIASWMERYDASPKKAKKSIAEQIVWQINDDGGRFLKKNARGVWEEADPREASEKVSHGFRKKREMDLKQRTKMAQFQRQSPVASTVNKLRGGESSKRVKA